MNQTNTDGDALGDACDADDDNDTWGTWQRGAIGTDPLDACSDNPSDNAWPTDINNDTFSDITDISALTRNFGKSLPPASAREGIGPEPAGDGYVDITDIAQNGGPLWQGMHHVIPSRCRAHCPEARGQTAHLKRSDGMPWYHGSPGVCDNRAEGREQRPLLTIG